ncbi:MAG: zf-HC2 domain-containing protein [Gemmatimonadales bacterium]
MSHLDEGTLHAMLDGELEAKEVAEIQAHVASCTSCGLRLREVREFLDEADRLIASVEMDGAVTGAPMRRSEPAAAPDAASIDPPRAQPRVEPTRPEPVRPELPVRSDPPKPEPMVRSQPAARPEAPVRPEPTWPAPPRPQPHPVSDRPVATETWNAPPPPLLMPDNESVADRRMRRMRKYGWAAMLLVFVGAGFIGVRMREPAQVFDLPLAHRNTNAVVSPEETARPEATASTTDSAAQLADKPAAAKQNLAAKAPARADAPRNAAKALAKDTGAGAAAGSATPAQSLTLARQADTEPKNEAQPPEDAPAESDDSRADSVGTEDLASVRERASEALADLDRERRRKESAAATAALDAQRRRRSSQAMPAAATARPAPVAAAAPAPTPPTLEQRAQVYLRIGLDEASRQLGGPAHVIEGMSAMFMGLAQGVVVSGADATRPVVRVVYQDSQGRLIMLDQQRLRPGQPAPQGSNLGWLLGETALWLHGEAGPDVLRLYRPRVR